jgi:hypothetical protein
MFQIIILNLLLTLAYLAAAQNPVPQSNGDCPVGYTSSGDYCKPINQERANNSDVIEKRGVNCPPGYWRSGSGHCKQAWNSDTKAMTRSGTNCPTGYHRSGEYCKPIYSSKPRDHYAIEKVGNKCPTGFRAKGYYCERMWKSSSEALPRKSGSTCPSGYRSKGDYCVKF